MDKLKIKVYYMELKLINEGKSLEYIRKTIHNYYFHKINSKNKNVSSAAMFILFSISNI